MKKTYVFLLFWVLSTTGCLSPTVDLKDAVLTSLTQRDMEVALKFNVFNPNEYPLPIEGIDWDLDLFQSNFTNGKSVFSRNIKAKQNTAVDIPLGITFQTLSIGAVNMVTRPRIPWGFDGGMGFSIPTQSQPIRVGFNSSGSWPNPLLDGTINKLFN